MMKTRIIHTPTHPHTHTVPLIYSLKNRPSYNFGGGIHGGAMKRLAIIAHDGQKKEVLDFARKHKERLEDYSLIGTKSTGTMLREALGLDVETVLSGPVGGDAQIAAQVVVGEVAMVFFIVDPLDKHPHDPDIQTLLRACNVHNIPLATNLATAALLLQAHDHN